MKLNAKSLFVYVLVCLLEFVAVLKVPDYLHVAVGFTQEGPLHPP